MEIEVEISSENATMMNMVRFGYLPPLPADPIADAVAAAKGADVAVVFVGTNQTSLKPHFCHVLCCSSHFPLCHLPLVLLFLPLLLP